MFNDKINWEDIPKDVLLEPYIELDGGYAVCFRCGQELDPMQEKCSCGQVQDWSWMKKFQKN